MLFFFQRRPNINISLPFNKNSIKLTIPGKRISAILEPNNKAGIGDPAVKIRAAFEGTGKSSFRDFLKLPGELLVIVNDGTRPTPTRTVLEAVEDELHDAGAWFIVATGVHRKPVSDEYTYIFGSTYDRFKRRIHVHDAVNDEMAVLGTTSRNTRVFINRIVSDAGKILVIGSVEPHYFAGYTGGRKAFLPGTAAFTTIEQNHSLALSPSARTLELSGNPVHEDMIEACGMVRQPVYSIMTVLDKEQDIYAVTAGGIYDAFEDAVKRTNEVFVVPFKEKADIVIACARYPMDVDLYQAQKAIENGKLALKKGGVLILIAACRDGIGDLAFSNLLSSCSTPADVFTKIRKGYRLGYHKAAKIAELCTESRILAYTGLPPEALRQIFLEPVKDLQAVVDSALLKKDSRIIIIPDASVTVPFRLDTSPDFVSNV